jgi:hypothetical protein
MSVYAVTIVTIPIAAPDSFFGLRYVESTHRTERDMPQNAYATDESLRAAVHELADQPPIDFFGGWSIVPVACDEWCWMGSGASILGMQVTSRGRLAGAISGAWCSI